MCSISSRRRRVRGGSVPPFFAARRQSCLERRCLAVEAAAVEAAPVAAREGLQQRAPGAGQVERRHFRELPARETRER
jgi:hypothetical protein